jgi:coxsackievirus/adenovirus receptor
MSIPSKLSWPGFSCICPDGVLCSDSPRQLHAIPDFTGSSYLKFSSQSSSFAQSFTLDLWFLSRRNSGVLIHSKQSHPQNRGDFFSLSINERGFVEFSFDLGSGGDNNMTLATRDPMTLNRWHSVRISRVRKVASIQMDEGEIVSGETRGSLSELNLDSFFYVGGFPMVKETPFLKTGLDGSIQRLIVNGEVWDDLIDRAVEVAGVIEYTGHPCYPSNPCRNHGSCLSILNDFQCKCSKRYSGRNCQKNGDLLHDQENKAVSFDGKTFMTLSAKGG